MGKPGKVGNKIALHLRGGGVATNLITITPFLINLLGVATADLNHYYRAYAAYRSCNKHAKNLSARCGCAPLGAEAGRSPLVRGMMPIESPGAQCRPGKAAPPSAPVAPSLAHPHRDFCSIPASGRLVCACLGQGLLGASYSMGTVGWFACPVITASVIHKTDLFFSTFGQ